MLPDVSFIGTGAVRAPAGHPGGRRPVPRHQAGGPGRQRGPVEHHRVRLNYDENDGFFDHVVPPTPNPKEFPEEFVTLASPAGTPGGGLPDRRRVPGPGLRHLALDGGRPDLLRGLRPHLLPAADRGGRGGRRPVRQGPGHLPQHQPLAAGRPSATSPGPCARRRRSRPRPTPSSTPPPRRPTWPPRQTAAQQPLPPRPGATQQFPAEVSTAHEASSEASARAGRDFLPPAPCGTGRPRSAHRRNEGPGGIVVPETVSHFIGGQHVHSALGKTFGVADPATGKEYAQVAVGIAGDVNQAVLAAQTALETGPWPGMAAAEQGACPARYRGRDRRAGRRHRRRRGAGHRPAGHPGQGAGRTGGRALPPRRRPDHGAGSGRRIRRARPVQLRGGAPGRRRRADHAVAHAVPGSGAGSRARPGRGLHGRAQAG